MKNTLKRLFAATFAVLVAMQPVYTAAAQVSKADSSSYRKAQTRYNAGKTVFLSGTALSLVTAQLAAADYFRYKHGVVNNYDPETGTHFNGGAFLIAPFLLGASAVFLTASSAIGIPLLVSGNNGMTSSELFQPFAADANRKGWCSNLDLRLSTAQVASIGYSYGRNFNKCAFLGAGAAAMVKLYEAKSSTRIPFDKGAFFYPVYLDSRFTFGSRRVAPYLGAQGGISFQTEGERIRPYASFNYGLKIRNEAANPWWIGFSNEFFLEGHHCGFMVSHSF